MILHIRSVFANLCDSLNYIQMVSTHTMEYINAATSGTLLPHFLPVIDLQKMLQHIDDTLPPTQHLPISSEDTLHFYRYLHTHILMKNKQFLLLIDIPIQDRPCQITVQQILTLDIPHGNYSVHYDVHTKYFGVTKDATMAVELSTSQFQACQQANGQFCSISTPFQPLANPPTCIAALYVKSKTGIASTCSLQICKTTATNLPTLIAPDVWILTTLATAQINTMTLICLDIHGNHIYPDTNTHTEATYGLQCHLIKFLPTPMYETPTLDVNISLNMANLYMLNISAQKFHLWQHLGSNRSDMEFYHLTPIPSIPVHKIYQHLLNSTMPVCLSTQNHQGILIPSGLCLHIREYMFQL